jgi:FeS assembly SUF system protein
MMAERDPFDFGSPEPVAESTAGAAAEAERPEVERPEGGEDDPALMAPVLAALKTVQDPEIPVDLVELGLIYELIVKKGGIVFVEMTLTTPSCPVAASMPGEVEAAVRAVPGVNDARVKLVWTPTWTPERMSEEAKLELGML